MLALAILPGVALCASPEFSAWAKEFGKIYSNEAAALRAELTFLKNAERIAALNANPADSAEYGHTRWSDFTPEEFRRAVLSARPSGAPTAPETAAVEGLAPAPASFDWRDRNVITPVKDQGSCGSCWAVSAVENVETITHLAGRPLEPLSVQEVLECDKHDNACYGGFPSKAFTYMIESGGISTEAAYPSLPSKTICLANQTFNKTCGDGICDDPPLTQACDVKCSQKTHPNVAKIKSWTALPTDEGAIAQWLAQHGPPSVAIDASGNGPFGVFAPWLQFYHRGVANPHCKTGDKDALDHALHLVGYGTDKGKDYWLVKNSWGERFGEKGYFRLLRGQGKCGVNLLATSALAGSEALVV
jgi:cathepsin F